MGTGFTKMKKQRRQLEEQMQMMQEMLKNKSFVGQSGGGLVTVTLSGEKALKEIKIKPECVDPTDVEGLEDLILAAFTDASKKAEEDSSSAFPFEIPEGLSFPL